MKVNLIRVNGAMRIAFLLICYLATCVQLNAQAPKLVMGRILDKEASEKKRKPVPFDISSIGDIKIYYFNTVQEGKDMEAALNKDNISLTLSAMNEVPDATGAYSWWSYRFQARAKNAGWRIDYFLVSDRIREKITQADILTDIQGSDHCPVTLEIDV